MEIGKICVSCCNSEYYAKNLSYCYAHELIVDNRMSCGLWSDKEYLTECPEKTCNDCPFGNQKCVICAHYDYYNGECMNDDECEYLSLIHI